MGELKPETKLMIITVLISLIMLIGTAKFQWGLFQKRLYSLVDICFMYYPENYGKYEWVKGFWASGDNPSLTITVDGRIKHAEVAYDKLEASSDYGVGGAFMVYYEVCNSKGDCVSDEQTFYAFDYGDEYSNCINDCNKYNVPGQCKYGSETPIPYTCDYICRYQGSANILFSPMMILPADKTYTITIKRVRYLVDGNWVDADRGKYPYIAWVVFYDPNDKPWLYPTWEFLVVDRETKEPIANAKISVDGNVVYTAEDGTASIQVAPGTYQVTVEKEGYVKDSFSFEFTSSITTTVSLGKIICTPGEIRNLHCEDNYKAYEICSEDGTAWVKHKARCVWCGDECVEERPGMVCPEVMPPEGYECRCIDGNCTAVIKAMEVKAWFIYNDTCVYKEGEEASAWIEAGYTPYSSLEECEKALEAMKKPPIEWRNIIIVVGVIVVIAVIILWVVR